MSQLLRPLAALLLISVTFACALKTFARSSNPDWRLNVLTAYTILGAGLAIGIELLSAFAAVNLAGMATVWTAGLLAFLVVGFLRQRSAPARVWPELRRQLQVITYSYSDWIPAAVCGLVIGVLLLGALAAAPNNWDSMTYHLSRAMHWQQDQSLAFYPTDDIRQLDSGPLTEMGVLSLLLLAGSDRLVNLAQWSAMVAAAIGVSLLAKQLGASRQAQITAALIAVTIPMGILQATSTQTDYVVSVWLVCFVIFGLRCSTGQGGRLDTLLTGASLGLAVLTKATALLFTAPFAVWIALALLRRFGWRGVKDGLVITGVALVLNFGQFARNAALFHNPLGPTTGYTNDIVTGPVLVSNVLRNMAVHLGTPSHTVNRAIESVVVSIDQSIGIDPNDPRNTYTWPVILFSVRYSLNEDLAGNGPQLVLIILGLLVMWRSRNRAVVLLGVCLLFAFTLFCLILKWQPWNSRLHLPLFVLGAAVVAASLDGVVLDLCISLLMLVLALWAVPFLLFNGSRPLVGPNSVITRERVSQYFYYRENLRSAYGQASQFILERRCAQIGLMMGADDYEYPFWILTDAVRSGITLRAIDAQNTSAKLAQVFRPCAILDTRPNAPESLLVAGTGFQKSLTTDQVVVYIPGGTEP